MPNLQHPATGEHVRASIKTAERLIEEGWEKIADSVESDAEANEPTTADAPPTEPAPSAEPSATEPTPAELPTKLGELVKYAEEHQLFDADQIAAWRKPGTKTADVKSAIEKKLAEVAGQ